MNPVAANDVTLSRRMGFIRKVPSVL